MNETSEMPTQYRCLLAKLEELLRYYRIVKKNDKNNALQDRVKNKSNEIIAKLQLFPIFEEIEKECRYKIELAFREIKPESAPAPRPNNNAANKAKTIEQPKRGFGSSSMSSFSSQSSQSSQSNPVISSVKKQVPIVQERPKIISPPVVVEKPNIEPPLKVIKQEVKPEQEAPRATITPKPDLVNESMSSSKSSISENNEKKEGSSISSIENTKYIEKVSKSQGSQRSFLGLLDQNESEDNFRIELNRQKSQEKVETPSGGSLSFQNKEEDSQKFSQASHVENTIDTIVKFCCDNKQKLNSELLFNQDIFDYIREDQGDFIYLFGVNKPQGKKMQKLYACTLMKFSTAEVMKCDDLFEKETKDFKNNIRTPIGLILKGNGPNAIQPEHIKFLINLQCPYMIVLVLKDYQQYDGFLCHFHDSVLGRIRITPRKQLGQCAQELAKKTYALPFGENFLPKEKTRYVITKSLNRTVVSTAEEAPNAITISDNDCIRQEKNSFNYKLHSKFLVSTKPQYSIYYVNNSIVNARIGFKDFQQFKKQALSLQPKVPAIFSLNLARDNIPIKKEFFEVLLQCNKIRDPNIFLNLSNISVKKTIVVALRADVTQEMLDTMEPLQYKAFEKDTALTFCLLVIGKNNAKEFQADGKNELIQIKSK